MPKIYRVDNLENGKAYIGQTHRDISTRFQEHCSPKQTSYSKLKNAIKKYGKEFFTIEVIWESDTCTQADLDAKEQELIKFHNTLVPYGYNLTHGGAGGVHSKETKKLLSEKSKKMWQEKRDYMTGKRREQWTDERKARLSATLIQNYKDHPELRNKVSSIYRASIL